MGPGACSLRPGPMGSGVGMAPGQILSADHPAGERPVLGQPAGALGPAVAAVPQPGHRPLSGFRLRGGAHRPGPLPAGAARHLCERAGLPVL